MMRSLFSGVAGLKNHQTRMDVIGNNIANVNTAGFKASRVNFQDILSQSLQGASAAQGNRGGTNPMQIGLGMGVASIDTLFTDGAPQTTGKQTDLYIQGQGFFVVSDGANQYYTRAGNFDFDTSGNYVIPGSGLKVMGWMPDAAGNINTTGPITSIQVPAGTTMAPKVSTEIAVGNNLSADGKGTAVGIPTADKAMDINGQLDANAKVGTVVSFTVNTYLQSGALVPITINYTKTGNPGVNTWSVTAGDDTGSAHSITVPLATPADDFSLTIEGQSVMFHSAISNGANTLTGQITALTAADANTSATMSGVIPADAKENATVSTNISVIDNTGNRITIPVTLKKTSNAEEWEVSTTDPNITITAPGTFIVGDSLHSSISVTGSGTLSALTTIDMSGITTGKSAIANTSLSVYDSVGTAHKVDYTFTKTGVPGEWVVSAKVDGTATAVNNDKVTFNSKGVLISPTSAATGPLVTVPGSNGAVSFPVTMNLFLENGTTPAVTQYSGESTVLANSTDGYTSGTIDMSKLTIDKSGTISAIFSNGINKTLGQVALATFNNPGGLSKVGDTMFAKSNNSGQPQVGAGSTGGRGSFISASLEMSNVDLAQQFSDMIITQRGFQANSKIITTTDEMLELLANLKR